MKAVQITQYGGIENLQVVDVPVPSPGKHQVLVEIHAVSINPFDVTLRNGTYKEFIPLKFPVTVGGDFAGRITALGEDVSEFVVRDEVYGSAITLSGGSGAFAQFASANTASISKKPKNLNFSQAASLPLVGSSSVQALEEHIKLQKDQKILIHGGAGGIGSIAIQVAKSIGAYVATTVNADSVAFATALGADQVIDYTKVPFATVVKDFDAVFDTVGGETTNQSYSVLKKRGTLVTMVGQPDAQMAQTYGVTAIGQNTHIITPALDRVAQLADNGSIKPLVDKAFPPDQVQEAFTLQEQGRPRSKVVITFIPS